MRLSTVLRQLAFGTLKGQPGEAPTTSPDNQSHFDYCYSFRDRNDLAQAGTDSHYAVQTGLEPPPHLLASSSQVLTLQVCVTWSH